MRKSKWKAGERVRVLPGSDLPAGVDAGTVVRHGKDALGIYVEVRLDSGELLRIHPSGLRSEP